ncbi:MAG: DUF6364 family protein [Thiobacillus sp.]|nr:DUF6364 family protein [Thiobacillus sp.]MDP2056913.1 DUF6364 family protein [Thiobacillus sp.]
MSTNKLTLSIDAATVKKAKRYVAAHGTSLSRLLTQYLASLPDDTRQPFSPRVSRLAGVLPQQTDIEEYKEHKEHKEHLHGKYGL